MNKTTKIFTVISLMFLVSACSSDELGLGSLGTKDDFSDVEIEDDFQAPDEEKEEEIVDNDHNHELPLSLENTFYIENKSFALARGPAQRWDGCKSGYKSTGGYNSDVNCGRAFLQEKFGKKLNQAFYKCSFDAAKDAGYPTPTKIFVNHLGSYNDRTARNSTRLSNHAYARALDIKHFNLVDINGKNYRVSTLLREYFGQQAKFYDSFRQCWKDALPSSCRPGNTEYQGSIGHKSSKMGGNTLHNDHIHLSFPTCAG